MTTQELTAAIFQKLNKVKFIVIGVGVVMAVALFLYAKQKPVTYTSRATVFPLTSGNENSATSSAIGALLGAESSKSFSDDASINIVELAQSRTTREQVAAIRDSSTGNKTIAELLVDDINNHRGWMEAKVKMPPNEYALITWAGNVLRDNLNASINKNSTLILTYTGRTPELVRVISYGFINKISQFYIELKQQKAKVDFEFASSKVDSLRKVMNTKDNQLIAIDKRTLFTNTDKLEFRVPTENLLADKQMIRQQYAQAVANQQNAAYKLQKATPLIKILDKPEPPYEVENKSPVMFAVIGLIAGLILTSLFFVSGLILRYISAEIRSAIFGSGTPKTMNTTTTVTPL